MKTMYIVLCALMLVLFSALYALDTTSTQPGKLAVKIKPEFRQSLQKGEGRTGIAELDQELRILGVSSIKARFQTDPRKSASSELELWFELQFSSSTPPQAIANSLAANPFISHIEPIYIDRILEAPNDPLYPSSLNYPFLQAEEAWNIHKGELGSQQVIIAVVDTGSNWTHPDLAGNVWNNQGEDANSNGYTMYFNGSAWVIDAGDLNGIDDDGNGKVDDLIGWDFMLNANGDEAINPSDAGSHGTIVSGLAAGRTNNGIGISSLSWNLTLMPISCTYPGQAGYIFKGYEAIIYAAENGADVINCSWGSTAFSQANKDAIDYAYSLGAVVVAAAGNSNNSIPLYPAAYPKVVATAALLNDGTKWSGSNFGGYIDVGAPNQSVQSLSGAGYTLISGTTSYASPITSALVGLVKSYHPGWTQEQIINQVKASCVDIDFMNPGKANLLGEGRLNAYNALSMIDPQVDQELALALFELRSPTDSNSNHAIEPGETFSLNLTLRNYAFGVGANSGLFTLSSSNPNVTITNNSFSRAIPPDEFFSLDNAFSVTVSPTAVSQFVSFTLTCSSEVMIASGASLSFQVLIHNGGIFVWEGAAGARDQSGSYIRDRLQAEGYTVVYGTAFPASFFSFEAVFLSFGSLSANVVRFDRLTMFQAVRDYLHSGGKLYMEGADAIGFDLSYYLPDVQGNLDAHEVLWPLLGIQSADDGNDNAINGLNAQLAIFGGINFGSSAQTDIRSIDRFEPLSSRGRTAYTESDYGNVAIASAGSYGQKSFVFSYALRELVDGVFPSTRANLLDQIMLFFEDETITLPVELSSFTAVYEGAPILHWSTASETASLGFNVYRNLDPVLGTAIKANPLLLPAAGYSSQPNTYSFTDEFDSPGDTVFYWLEFLSLNGNSQFSAPLSLQLPLADDPENPPPVQFQTQLGALFPNPFSSGINIRYQLSRKTELRFEIYNLKGQLIKRIEPGEREAGWHNSFWDGIASDGSESARGIYLLRMISPEGIYLRKLVRM